MSRCFVIYSFISIHNYSRSPDTDEDGTYPSLNIVKAIFEILKKERQTANDSDIIYPEESNGLIDVRKVIEENTGGYGFIPDAEFAAIEDTDIHSFTPNSDLSMSEDINRPVFIPNAAGLVQAEYEQAGRGIHSENVVSGDNAFEKDILNTDNTDNTDDTDVDKATDGSIMIVNRD